MTDQIINNEVRIVLGSRSPRRRELLGSVVDSERLLILAPTNSREQGFTDLRDHEIISQRLLSIVSAKTKDVSGQLPPGVACCVITADTIVVATESDGTPVVLGQPDPDEWEEQVRNWMLRYYSGRTHEVWTGFQVAYNGQMESRIVRTTVEFYELSRDSVERYIETAESLGKAGGYAIQGAAATFVKAIDGSLTNVIGLPVFEVMHVMNSMGLMFPVLSKSSLESE